MAYATEANVLDWCGEQRLAAAVEDTASSLTAKIAKALLSAEAKINGILARAGFAVPVDTSESTALASLLEECATVFAVVSLLRIATPPAVHAQAKEYREMLGKLRAGDFGLVGTAAPSRKAYFVASTTDADRPAISEQQLAYDAYLMGGG